MTDRSTFEKPIAASIATRTSGGPDHLPGFVLPIEPIVKDINPESAADPPMVTIMIPTYGQAQYLPAAIESALAQDYPSLEVVVSDDASPDDTAEIVQRYATDARLHYVRRTTNLGRTRNYRTTLMEDARGTYVLNLDGDDWLCDATYISDAMALASKYVDLAMIFARACSYDDGKGSYFETTANRGLPPVSEGTELFLRYPEGSVSIPHMTALYRRDLAISLGFYQHDIIGSDSIAMLLILPGRKVGFVDRVVGVWRRHATNATWISDFSARRANFLVADLPAMAAVGCSTLDLGQLQIWRRDMAIRLAHQSLADSLSHGHITSAALQMLYMTIRRPMAAIGTVMMLLRKGHRLLRSRSRPLSAGKKPSVGR